MKKVIFFFLAICMFLLSCDGEDSPRLEDGYCYALINVIDVTNPGENSECEVTFLFIDDLGNEYEEVITVPNDNENPKVIALPKNRCYGAWVLDVGDGTCGTYDFDIEIPSNHYGPVIEAPGGGIYETPPCFSFSEFVDDRLDIYDENIPEYTFCLDGECSCPDVNS